MRSGVIREKSKQKGIIKEKKKNFNRALKDIFRNFQ